MGNHLLTIKEVEMLEKERAARALGRGTGGTGSRRPGDTGLRTHSNAKPVERQAAHGEAVALALSKRGRLCIVGKVVPVDGEPVLAVCWRNQRGTRQAVSIPLPALAYAEAQGCRRFVLRDDRLGVMRIIPFVEMRRKGWVGADGELYVRLGDMAPCPWRPWPYAERTVNLDEAISERPAEPEGVQLGFWGEVRRGR